jgi:hypothetical protein
MVVAEKVSEQVVLMMAPKTMAAGGLSEIHHSRGL